MKFALITFRYSVDGDLGFAGPDAMLRAGLAEWLHDEGNDVVEPLHVKLSLDEENAYGSSNRIGFANWRLAKLVMHATEIDALPIILESNCYDPLEQELIEQIGIEIVSVCDIRGGGRNLRLAMERLNREVDAIYVHSDVDALDSTELGGMRLSEPDGPSSVDLAAAVYVFPKNHGFGVADINSERDVDGQTIQSAMAVVRGCVTGLRERDQIT